MSIVSTFLTGAGSVSDVAKHSTEPRPLALQPEEAGAPAFDALLGAAMGPGARREARERHEASIDRGRRAERSRSTERASERASERANERAGARAAERARASAATAERASAERASAAREAGAASASRRADELRYGMLSERRAAHAESTASETEAVGDVGVPPRQKAASESAERADQASAAGTESTAARATMATEAAQAAAAQLAETEAAAAAALAAAASDPTRVVRDAGTLAPEFRERLERVVSRMEREFGHEVRIVEAARTGERQDFLYEQGRTREGAVVTWTRDSKHLDGRAADVMIDGSYADQTAFQRLRAIAAEEGLRTLGARDPGHIELAGAAAGSARGAAALAALQTMATIEDVRVAAGAVAEAAQVAAVAQVATVAEVAPVATPGLGGGIGAPRAAIAQERRDGGRSDERSERRARADAVEGHVTERREERAEAQAGLRMAAERAPQLRVEAAAPVATTDAASRISRVLELQDAAATPRPMSHMTLRLENAAGGEDRIRVDLRGLGVGTNIDVTDAATADRLGARVSELQRALGQHGLESESVRIGVRPELPDAARSAAAAAAHLTERDVLRSADTNASSSQQQQSPSQDSQRQGADDRRRTARDQDEPGQQAGESRHRSHREPQGDRTR